MPAHLLVGCGHKRDKRIKTPDSPTFDNLVTLDNDPETKPDVLWDLTKFPLPFADNTFDEVHAYEVLEHTGAQGDLEFFFEQFYEFWRILKPNGIFAATVPRHNSIWAWGDPGHTRVITAGSLVFLSKEEYNKQLGITAMSDYSRLWKGDFVVVFVQEQNENFLFAMRALKGEVGDAA